MHHVVISFINLILCVTQVSIEATDALSWFPVGDCLKVSHIDFQMIREGDLYKEFTEFIDSRILQPYYNGLPPSLSGACLSLTRVTLAEYEFERDKNVMSIAGVGSLGMMFFPNANHAINVAVKAGEMSPTGESVLGRAVFSFHTPKERKQYRAAVGIQEELLFAESIENLELMILAGTGQAYPMLASEDYLDLPDYIPEDAPQWTILLQATRNREYIRRLRRNNADEEKIKRLSERYALGTQYRIVSFSMDEQLLQRYIIAKGDKNYEEAVQRGETMKSYEVLDRSTPVKARYHNLRANRTTKTYEGNKVIYTTVYDSELIEADKEYREERKAEEAARKAEEEKKDK